MPVTATLQPLGEKHADGIERLLCRLDSSDAADESMGHPHLHVKPGIGACGHGTLDVSLRVIEQDFVVADVDADRRQP